MKTVKNTVLEVLVLGAVAVVIACTVNAVRAKGSIKLTRNYFDRSLRYVPVTSQPEPTRPADEFIPPQTGETPAPGAVVQNPDSMGHIKKPLEHPYQEVSFEQAVAIFKDPNTAMGVYLFVDARDDDAYEEGHIPGAVQADHYRIEDFIDRVMALAQAAEKVVVYCDGGDCEDSMFVCGDLLEAGVPYEKLYLFGGGWKAWKAHRMPTATGREDEAFWKE